MSTCPYRTLEAELSDTQQKAVAAEAKAVDLRRQAAEAAVMVIWWPCHEGATAMHAMLVQLES